MTAFELAIQDVSGIAIATRVRPTRVELATALSSGGLTPSVGLIRAAVDAGLPVHVLVRPRLGDFEYGSEERALLRADAGAALDAGAAGIVVGGTREGEVDRELMGSLIDLADGAEVTFHRAFDVVPDRDVALDTLVELGVTRILTSGGAERAVDALDELRALALLASGRVQLMAGAGVDASNAAAIAATGVDAVHASAKRTVRGAADAPSTTLSLGSDDRNGGADHETTDEDTAVAIRDALRR
jgi:copper homeostasis protein